MKIKHGMILTAGLGKRMQPLTNKKPKPLLEVGGSTLLERAINLLVNHGVEKITINVHHLANQIEKFISDFKSEIKIKISNEKDLLLDTGGGIISKWAWAKQVAANGICSGNGVVAKPSGGAIVTGHANALDDPDGLVQFDGSNFFITNNKGDAFVGSIKYDGTWEWVIGTFGGDDNTNANHGKSVSLLSDDTVMVLAMVSIFFWLFRIPRES